MLKKLVILETSYRLAVVISRKVLRRGSFILEKFSEENSLPCSLRGLCFAQFVLMRYYFSEMF